MNAEWDCDELSRILDAQNGNMKAMQELIDRHHPLIYALASRIQCMNLEKDALLQAGAVGLMQAIKRYNPDYEAKLTTYAIPWILGEMKKTLRQEMLPSADLSLEKERDHEGQCLLTMLEGSPDIDLCAIDLRFAVEKLNKEAQLVICLRYFRDKTQKETALLLKKSQAQISRIERQALDTLHGLLA